MASTMEEVPVLIIGTGPSGATTALLLANMGIRSLFISRHRGIANTPRAHIFNQRAMEILRDAGLQHRVEDIVVSSSYMQHTSWSNTLSGQEYGRLWSWGNKPSELHRYATASPCVMSDLPQSYLEPILVDEAVERGGEVRFGHEFVSMRDCGDRVNATIRHVQSGQIYDVRCQYLVGADGARSAVIEAVGIPIIGKTINSAFNVHIEADLAKYMINRPCSLNWVLNAEAPEWSAVGNFRMVRPWTDWVVSMHPATKDGQVVEPTDEQIIDRLHQMIGDRLTPIRILSKFRWSINDQVAETWQCGRVLCIGDAVHRHPPINGLGSNACIADAFNLAWKLAYVLGGYAGPALLDSVTVERKPVGDGVVRRANAGMEAHRRLWPLLGLTTEDRQRAMQVLQDSGNAGRLARKRLDEAFEGIDEEVQALGIQLNQIYVDSPAVSAMKSDSAPSLAHLNLLKEVAVSTFPGYHLPHVWLARSGQSPRVSSLDLCGHGEFTLLTGPGGKSWVDAARDVSARAGWPKINAHSIGFLCDYMDCYRDWQNVRGTEENGVVLVRPDHFVAWRCATRSPQATELLLEVMTEILARP